MHALLDGDILLYTAASIIENTIYEVRTEDSVYTTEKASEWRDYVKRNNLTEEDYELTRTRRTDRVELAYSYIKEKLKEILDNTASNSYSLCLTGSHNFREQLEPNYKANRNDNDKPIYLEDVKQYMLKHQEAFLIDYIEADDYLGLAQYDNWLYNEGLVDQCDTVIVTTDKDLDTIPGHHYNPVTGEAYWLDEEDADYSFWIQMLTGDTADNIKGVYGYGKKKAAQSLPIDPMEWPAVVYSLYEKVYGEEANELFTLNQRLLNICRTVDEVPVSEEIQQQISEVVYGPKSRKDTG